MGELANALIQRTKATEQQRALTFFNLVRSGVPDEEAAKEAGYDRDFIQLLNRPIQRPSVDQP